jgi:hypothetical protein
MRLYRIKSIDRVKASERFTKYGISQEEYNQKLSSQNGLCAICQRALNEASRPSLDHCHSRHIVRGILCSHCNFGIGCFFENKSSLSSAIAYLSYWENCDTAKVIPFPERLRRRESKRSVG